METIRNDALCETSHGVENVNDTDGADAGGQAALNNALWSGGVVLCGGRHSVLVKNIALGGEGRGEESCLKGGRSSDWEARRRMGGFLYVAYNV